MRKIIAIAVAAMCVASFYGEASANSVRNHNDKGTEDIRKIVIVEKASNDSVQSTNEDPVYMISVEQKPTFPGGERAMYQWLGAQINYPKEASDANIQGRVIVSFIVEKDGSISNVHVTRGQHPALDAESVRVVNSMPKWSPGLYDGKPVRVQYMLPITFRLPDPEPQPVQPANE